MKNENDDVKPEKRELTAQDMIKGIGRKATDEELIEYLSKEPGEPINLETALAKYLKK